MKQDLVLWFSLTERAHSKWIWTNEK